MAADNGEAEPKTEEGPVIDSVEAADKPARPLWAKGAVDLSVAVQTFCAGDDVLCDRALFLHDVRASVAHANGLARVGVLAEAERAQLVELLRELAEAFTSGAFVLDARYEDGHSAIEAFLVEKAGEVGKKIHTARSRNDQVLVAQRLFVKEQLAAARGACVTTARALLDRAHATGDVVMPGYTHLQRAMPTTLAAWLAGHAEGFLDDVQALDAAVGLADANPLGTGAGFGVSLGLDREGVRSELGFGRVVVTAQAAQNGRGKIELFALQALHLAALDVRRLAWDLSLFAMSEIAFVRLPDRYTTGSSLMPNKRNPDVVELLRALPSVVEGAIAEAQGVLGLPSSYHRDLQVTKAPVVRACARVNAGLALVPDLVEALAFDEEKMAAAITPDMFATDRALDLVSQGVPFRDAYVRAALEIGGEGGHRTAEESVAARVSLGGAGNLGLELLDERLRSLSAGQL
jgi:argininosuccinate lyase